MARKKSTPKTQKVLRSFTVEIPSGNSYVDVMRELSKINRKLFRQGMVVGIENIEFGFNSNPQLFDTVWLTAAVAGDTWSVHNSWTKGKALWDEMQHLVLEDNPSIEGKWADFKVHLDSQQLDGTTLVAKDAAGADYIAGEWDISDFVIPQHDVDPATGLPLAADQTVSHIVGPDLGSLAAGNLRSVGLVNAYQQSRATVFNNAPNVPPGMADSFFNKLTDSGSQEPELATVIEAENDNPPYDVLNYAGGALNAPTPVDVEFAVTSVGYPTAMMAPFVAQCGLIRFNNAGYKDGAAIAGPTLTARITVMAGKYKGIAAVPMGQ